MVTDSKSIERWQQEDADRLNALFKKHAKVTQAEFGVRYGIGSQGMVWQYLSGRRPLNIKAAEAFAHGLGISIDQFSPTIANQVLEASKRASEADKDWPFTRVSKYKILALDEAHVASMEQALLDLAEAQKLDISTK